MAALTAILVIALVVLVCILLESPAVKLGRIVPRAGLAVEFLFQRV